MSNGAASSSNTHNRSFFLKLLALIVLLGVLAWSAWYFLSARWYINTDDAYVNGNVVQITPMVSGTVVSIGADNGDRVQAGQRLIELDPSDAEVSLQAAQAELAQTVRQTLSLYNNVTAAQAEVESSKTDLRRANEDYQRRQGLAKSGSISEELLNHSRDALAAAESSVIQAEQKYRNSLALVGNTDVANNPSVKAAAAKLLNAFLSLSRSQIIAPTDGYIAKRTVQVGERVTPGRALMAVVPLHQVWVDANFKETQLKDMRLGQPVTLSADLYGDSVVYHGTIHSLGMGTGSAFSLLPAQNATGNWIKIVQRVPVRIELDQAELIQHPLRIGLSMAVTVDIHQQQGAVLAEHTPSAPVLSTTVYQQQLDAAHALIKKIVTDNLSPSMNAAQ